MAASKTSITIEQTINAPISKVWTLWTYPEHITKWNAASDDWHTPHAEYDLRVGGKFLSRMEAKDGSFGFDLVGFYDRVLEHHLIEYHLEDDRKVKTTFSSVGIETKISTVFDA